MDAPPLDPEALETKLLPLKEDSAFYDYTVMMAEVCQALYRSTSPATADAMMQHLKDGPNVPTTLHGKATLDPILIELENLMIRELFDSPFVYQALEGPSAFRLLILYPGSQCEALRGTIQHTTIKAGRSYEAISYTWGDDSKPCFILLDGCQMPLTKSLSDALVRLRSPTRERKLWADGLCINQKDNKEKGRQVALMPQIYTYSRRVLVHLGLQADGSELLPGLLEKISKVELTRIKRVRMSAEGFLSIGLPPSEDEVWKALVELLCRPWFLRVWIIQEAILARDILFFCGDWEMSWGLLSDLANRFDSVCLHNPQLAHTVDVYKAQHAAMSLGLILALHLSRSVVAKRLEILRRDIECVPLSEWERGHIESLPPNLAAKRDIVVQSGRQHRKLYPAIERSIFMFDEILASQTPIIKLLGMFVRNEATKYQDRLYALIGLASDINLEEFPPDYEETVDQTNARFGRKLVEKGQGIDLLFHATKFGTEIWNLSSPSWTPNWTSQRSMGTHWLKLGWAYHQYAGGFEGRVASTSYVSLVDSVHNVVKVTGFRLDQIQSVVKLFDEETSQDRVSKFSASSKQFFQQCEALMDGEFYITGEPWAEVLCRTLIADHRDRSSGKDYFSPDLVRQYEEAKFHLASLPNSRQSMNSWANAWFDLVFAYVFCKTRKGYACLVPEATCNTDEIFMFIGSDLPFVLRPIRALPGYYRFVGGCYVHGFMKGEPWKLEETNSDIFLF